MMWARSCLRSSSCNARPKKINPPGRSASRVRGKGQYSHNFFQKRGERNPFMGQSVPGCTRGLWQDCNHTLARNHWRHLGSRFSAPSWLLIALNGYPPSHNSNCRKSRALLAMEPRLVLSTQYCILILRLNVAAKKVLPIPSFFPIFSTFFHFFLDPKYFRPSSSVFFL